MYGVHGLLDCRCAVCMVYMGYWTVGVLYVWCTWVTGLYVIVISWCCE